MEQLYILYRLGNHVMVGNLLSLGRPKFILFFDLYTTDLAQFSLDHTQVAPTFSMLRVTLKTWERPGYIRG